MSSCKAIPILAVADVKRLLYYSRAELMTSRKIIPLDEGREEMAGPEDYAATEQYSDESLPTQSVPGAVPRSPDAPDSPGEKVSSGAPQSHHTPRTSARVSFDATAIDKPVRRRTLRQRTASKLASAVSMQTLVAPPSSKAELLAKQNQAIASVKRPSTHITRVEKVAYEIDQYISTRRGQIFTLTVVGLILIGIGGIFLKAVQPSRKIGETVWESWTYLADTGSHTSLAQDGIRVVGVLTTLVGILYFSVVMGFVVDGIRAKLDTLKKGKSVVAVENHTLLLGWTEKSVSLIRQICLANASENGGVIVVLAEMDKEELEAELESQIRTEELRGTRVIFRTGTPLLSVDLLKASAHRAKSIVIMANSTGDADRSDAAVLRTVLSLKTLPELAGHIVAELRDIDNDPLVRLVGGKEVEILVSHDIIGRLVLMSARSPGLARVYSSLLGFEGNEFYCKEWPECIGVAFGGLTERFPNAIPLGIKRKNGEVFICPDADLILEKGDQILVLAEDDDTYKACPPVSIEVGKVPPPPEKMPTSERILMCGWRRDIRDMIQLLDAIVEPETELHIICEEPIHLRNKLLLEGGLTVESLKNIKLVHYVGNTAIRRQLEKLPWHSFTSIMILSDQSRELDIMHSDSHSLASLLLIRDLQARSSSRNSVIQGAPGYCKCISEILDPRTQRTISTSATILTLSEFVQSNELVSCILAMISESRDVRVVLDELLGPQGAFFEVEPSYLYCDSSERVSFWQLAKRAMVRGDILCGYQVRGTDDTVLNPGAKDQPRSWVNVDMIVIRNEDDGFVAHESAFVPVVSEDFERTTRSRQMKATYSRQRLLDAIAQESDLNSFTGLGVEADRSTIMRALYSFDSEDDDISVTAASSLTDVLPAETQQVSVRALIAAARILADALEQANITHFKNA
ncbi:Ion channel [Phytophthora fragariae]|uniref:Ion channel n=1 Tax=Phytophthora fragariae TaxID=53985 RepID=A0A6A3Z5X7_9STRA|nr:Ion channel [Phytophthora fragariae]KAE8946934.1 Ion channel [Phytophthora fragariae]KAE9026377.1 Ion channel [Phytophthora fragariae]KAE9133499.1 Ion channel [Phytophthora fragariae]KAE9153245.1 Ion channel [Phytophthora fragariae]